MSDFTIEHLRDAVFWLDEAGRVRRVNRAACESLGRSRETLTALRVNDFNPTIEPGQWAKIWQSVRDEGHWTFETQHAGVTGAAFAVHVRASFIEVDGEPLVCAVARDLSCRQHHEELLRASTLAKVSPALIFRTNRFGRWTWVNERWTNLTGADPADALVDAWASYVHPEDRERVTDGLRQAAQARTPWRDEFRLRGPQGEEVWVFGQAAPEGEDDGGYVGALLDVTDQNRAARALQEAKEAAEAANRLKSEFLANMSHELRTPLNGILGYAQLLTRDPALMPTQREGVEKIKEAGEHLLTLINDVLDLSRIESGRLVLEPVEFCLVDLLDSLADMARVRAEQKGLSFVYEPVAPFPTGVYGDERKLRQILLNLLGNAVKFTERGHVAFRVGVDPDGRIRFTVQDTGVGIPDDMVDDIFQPFVQIGGDRVNGTGLGLPIVRKLAKVLGAELDLDSRPGEGTTFTLSLALEARANIVPRAATPQRRLGYAGRSRKVLVVDDKPENRMLLVRMLSPLGFEVCEAGDGEEALRKVAKGAPDVVLMDLIMPHMDGFEATRRIRSSEAGKGIPIVALSASVFEESRNKSRAAGCDVFVPKPVRERELFDALDEVLPLQWVFDGDRRSVADAPPDPVTLDAPPSSYLEELHDLAEQGHIVGIRRKIDQIDGLGPQYAPFAASLRRLAKTFQLQQICDFVEPYRA